jgi:hypothetical protein
MLAGNAVLAGKIRDGSGDAEDTIMPARGE